MALILWFSDNYEMLQCLRGSPRYMAKTIESVASSNKKSHDSYILISHALSIKHVLPQAAQLGIIRNF